MAPVADLNEELMRLIGTRLGGHDFIDRVDKFPSEKPDRIVATFVDVLYPTQVSAAWLELRLRLNDDCNIIYIEDWDGTRWECRWDRHDNDHNAREHFHPPPTVTTATATDIDLPDDPNRAVETALRFVEDRIHDLWQSENVIYPSEYEFRGEYGPNIWK
ncbi:hypothetical protein [Halomarina pelagica]|uniref:hypothetical protein n=1 Tax=Halomarina pelagica TaxID=2961599 RepID=UPI0020C21621|nr:hypothetical protein [Halomarina sp. BND7]